MKKLVKTASIVAAASMFAASVVSLSATSTLAQSAQGGAGFCQASRIQLANGQWKQVVECLHDGQTSN